MKTKKKKKFIIIDGNAILHRAWHALPPLTAPDGTVVNALYGFISILFKTLREMQPDYIAVAWDRKEPTFRHKAFATYKAQREKQPEALYQQVDPIKQVLQIIKIPSYEIPGFEADDIIAALARGAEKTGNTQNIILTGDMDTLQLVSDTISVLALRKGITDTVLYDTKAVYERYGLRPEQLIDFKALRGDPSDNIPGVKGIGEKGATALLQAFGSVEAIYKHLDDCEKKKTVCKIREGPAGILRSGKDAAFLSKKLVTLVDSLPLSFDIADAARQSFDRGELTRFLVSRGFKSLVDRLPDEGPRGRGKEPSTQTTLFQKIQTKNEPHAVRRPSNKGDTKKFFEQIKEQGATSFKIVTDVNDVFRARTQGIALVGKDSEIFLQNVDDAKELLTSSAITKIGHDIKNDYKIAALYGTDITEPFFDCMIAAYLLNPGSRAYDIDSLGLQFLGERKVVEEDKENSAIRDARLSFLLWQKLEHEINTQGIKNLLYTIEFALIPVLAHMELAGVLINKALLEKMSDALARRLSALAHKIHVAAGTEFNINSPQQLANILFNILNLSPKTGRIRRGKTGASTAASELLKLRGTHPIIDLLFEHRELFKLKSTYVDALPALINFKTGRIHTSYNQAVTATGRLSSSDPNLQNIPIRGEVGREIRKAFVAPRGYALIVGDYSQFELRIAASIANEKNMIEAFRRGADIHTATAAEIWGTTSTQVTADMRRTAKAINFGIIYGMGPLGLAEAAGISSEEAKKFIAKYFGAYKALRNYIDETRALARSLGYVQTILGRRRYLPEIVSELPEIRAQAERMAVNMPIQGSQADLIKIAMIRAHEAIVKKVLQAKMILQVHDELVFEVPKDDVGRAGKIIKEIMEGVYKLAVPIVVDIKTGKNWGETAPLQL